MNATFFIFDTEIAVAQFIKMTFSTAVTQQQTLVNKKLSAWDDLRKCHRLKEDTRGQDTETVCEESDVLPWKHFYKQPGGFRSVMWARSHGSQVEEWEYLLLSV